MDTDAAIQSLMEAAALLLVGVVILSVAVALSLLFVSRLLPSQQLGTIAFFHPFADGGGGGERVLWCAVQAVHDAAPTAKVVIFTRAGLEAQQLIEDAQRRFNINLLAAAPQLQLVHLDSVGLLLPERYPRFTLALQALGSLRVGLEALRKLVPEVFIDTTGWAFTYPVARLAGCKVAAYTHYPLVSTNMIQRVATRQSGYNNAGAVSRSRLLSLVKLWYYRGVAAVYGLAGGCAHVVMANSSWTKRHLSQLFRTSAPITLVYPPCDTEVLQALPLDRRLKQLYLVSVAQFRPEKDHRLQLEAWALVKARAGDPSIPNSAVLSGARLVMVGSCRNDADRQRLQGLQAHAHELGVAGSVDWYVNPSFAVITELLGEAVAGLHTMRDEHFGISVVEYMAAGAIPIAHNSGGPQEDVVVEVSGPDGRPAMTGFLAVTAAQYADAITQVLVMDQRQRLHIAAAAQRHAASFSMARFRTTFVGALAPLLVPLQTRAVTDDADGGG